MDVSLVPLAPNPATGMSAGSSTVMASVARAEQRAALVAAGGVPSARRGRRGGPSQQLHLIRIDRVDNFVMNVYGRRSRSRSRSRGRSRGIGGGVPLLLPRPRPKARPLNVFVRHAAPVAARAVQTPLTPPSSPPRSQHESSRSHRHGQCDWCRQQQRRKEQCRGRSASCRFSRGLVCHRTPTNLLEWKFDNWARAGMRHRSQARPLLDEVYDDPPSLFVGFHGTRESGLLGILSDGQLKPGPASWGKTYVYAKGFLAYGCGGEDAKRNNSDEARRILKKIRERSTKHASGVIIEVSMWGIHKPCRIVEDEWKWAGNPTASQGSLTILARGGTPLSVRCGWILTGLGNRVIAGCIETQS